MRVSTTAAQLAAIWRTGTPRLPPSSSSPSSSPPPPSLFHQSSVCFTAVLRWSLSSFHLWLSFPSYLCSAAKPGSLAPPTWTPIRQVGPEVTEPTLTQPSVISRPLPLLQTTAVRYFCSLTHTHATSNSMVYIHVYSIYSMYAYMCLCDRCYSFISPNPIFLPVSLFFGLFFYVFALIFVSISWSFYFGNFWIP